MFSAPGPEKLSLSEMLRLSRPRFWMYLVGPFVVGLLIGARSPSDVLSWRAACFGFFFLFPANLFVYGVNDVYDFETDALNAKKDFYEARLRRSSRSRLLALALCCALPFLGLSMLACRPLSSAMMLLFLFLSHQYSAPPIRAKARPMLDSLFNGLYACPAFLGYFLLGGHALVWGWVASAWCWTMAMHAYSAVPDIQADTEAGLSTTATLLGAAPTLLLCASLYALAALGSHGALGWLSVVLGAVYVGMIALSMRLSLSRGPQAVMQLYKYFPALNTLAGFLLFWRIAWIKFAPSILAALSSR